MFTHFQSWDFCLPVRRGSGLHYFHIPRCPIFSLGWVMLAQPRGGPELSGFVPLGCFRWRRVKKVAQADSIRRALTAGRQLLHPGLTDTAKAGVKEKVARS